MDKIEKALNKLTERERKKLKAVLREIKQGSFRSLDVRKLKGREDIFRVRKGDIRVIFRRDRNGKCFILTIERRSSKTYKGTA